MAGRARASRTKREGPLVVIVIEAGIRRRHRSRRSGCSQHFTGLLVTFTVEPLTARLLQKAWLDAFPDANTPGEMKHD